jgi:hypothetical protein
MLNFLDGLFDLFFPGASKYKPHFFALLGFAIWVLAIWHPAFLVAIITPQEAKGIAYGLFVLAGLSHSDNSIKTQNIVNSPIATPVPNQNSEVKP